MVTSTNNVQNRKCISIILSWVKGEELITIELADTESELHSILCLL